MKTHNNIGHFTKSIAKVLSPLLFTATVILFFLVGLSMYQTYTVKKVHTELKTAKAAVEIETDWSQGMLEKNSDYKGWLTIFGTQVDHPVVQGETNDTYLRLSFEKQWNIAGTPFLDERCVSPDGGNIVIYGHMMYDDTMFGSLKAYKDLEFFKANNIALWQDESGEHYYSLFAAMSVPGSAKAEGFIDLQQWVGFLSKEQTEDMIAIIRDAAYIFKEPRVIAGSDSYLEDEYLFVVTCDFSRNNGRLVLCFKDI